MNELVRKSIGRPRAARETSSTDKPVSGRQSRRGTMRQEIIAAAKRRFADSGYWAASLRDIADDLGITAAALYRHFENKEDILWEIIRGTLDDVLKLVMAELSQDAPAATRFKNILRVHIQFTVENPNNTKVIFEDGHFLSAGYFAAAEEKQRVLLNIYRACISELAQSGHFHIPDATISAFYALSVVNGASRWYKPGGKWTLENVTDTLAELILRGLRNPGQNPGSGAKHLK